MKIPRLPLAAAAVVMTLLTPGCNAIYFYETDKVSLTVEVRPDSTGPIQGNFGFKQRVVALVPRRNGGKPAPSATPDVSASNAPADRIKKAAEEAAAKNPGGLADRERFKRDFQDALADQSDSDAMDVLSALRFHKLPKPEGAPWYRVSHMTIDSALITGGAARHVANPGRAIAALSGQRVTIGPVKLGAMTSIHRALNAARNADARAADLVGRLDRLAANLPETYRFTRYLRETIDPPALRTDPDHTEGKALPSRATFRDVLDYGGALSGARDDLAAIPPPPAAVTLDDQPLDEAGRTRLLGELAKVERLLAEFDATFMQSDAAREAAEYFTSRL